MTDGWTTQRNGLRVGVPLSRRNPATPRRMTIAEIASAK
jgi:hypothetical protein